MRRVDRATGDALHSIWGFQPRIGIYYADLMGFEEFILARLGSEWQAKTMRSPEGKPWAFITTVS